MHHGVTFNFGRAKVCSPAIFETCFSHNKDIWIAATYYYMYSNIIVLFPLTAILQLINFSLLINAVILLLNCLVLILHLYIHFLSLRHYFLYLKHYLDLCTVSLLLHVMVSTTISPGCGVRASLVLFL